MSPKKDNKHTITNSRLSQEFAIYSIITKFSSQHFPAGNHSGGATPDPIPNSVVKTSSADGTAVKTVGEQVVASLFFFEALNNLLFSAFFCVATQADESVR